MIEEDSYCTTGRKGRGRRRLAARLPRTTTSADSRARIRACARECRESARRGWRPRWGGDGEVRARPRLDQSDVRRGFGEGAKGGEGEKGTRPTRRVRRIQPMPMLLCDVDGGAVAEGRGRCSRGRGGRGSAGRRGGRPDVGHVARREWRLGGLGVALCRDRCRAVRVRGARRGAGRGGGGRRRAVSTGECRVWVGADRLARSRGTAGLLTGRLLVDRPAARGRRSGER